MQATGLLPPYRYWGVGLLFLYFLTGAQNIYSQAKRDSVLSKIDSLKPVIVRPKEIRPKLHGDTMEYNTGSIQMRVNANVEDLLGRLPGLYVDPDGTITYNGIVVKQLLVDGEDLFGSDPTIVTRNFDASRIAKVQLLDRISDQARFTGLDDGAKTKTLNLVLKEDSKKGYFGKIEAGADGSGLYNANGLLGSFHQREQFAALGLFSNIGTTSVSSNGSNIMAINGNDDGLGASAGQGIPRFRSVALHYANTWDGQGDHLVGNYQYSNSLTQPLTTTNTIQTIPDSVYEQYKRAQSVNRQDQHWGYTTYDWTIDSVSALRLNFHSSVTKANNRYSDTTLSTFNDTIVNRIGRSIQSVVNRNNVGGGIDYRIRSRKKTGRIFSMGTSLTQINSSTDGFIYSLNRYYQPDGQLQMSDTLDQRKQISNQTQTFTGALTVAEPLWGKNVIGLRYNLNYTENQSLQYTYNRGNGKYQEFIDSLSSHLDGYTMSQWGALVLQSRSRRFGYTITAGTQWYSYQQKNLLNDSLLRYHYINVIPHLELYYTPTSTTQLLMDYSASDQQPSLAQLQPIKNNNDPLHLVLGNPNLRPGFNQNLKLEFTNSEIWMYNLALNLGLSSNSISTRTIIDSLGRQVSQPINVDGGRNIAINLSNHKKILGVDAGMSASFSYNRSINYINADLSRNDSYISGGGFDLNKFVADKYALELNVRLAYFNTQSSINSNAYIHYWTQNHSGKLSIFFIPRVEISTFATYSWQEKSNVFTKDNSVLLWNASIGHNFMANRLALRLVTNNLLNQNAGITRTNAVNVNTENSTNILGRYWLLSLAWRFDHKYKNK